MLTSRAGTGTVCAVSALITALSVLGGCGGGNHTEDGTARRLRLRDATGAEIVLEQPAMRIVSLAPNLTELVFASGAGERLVGRTSYCNYPAAATAVPVVSDLATPIYEKILAADPDVVLMTLAGNSAAVHRKLSDLGLTVFVLATDRVDGIVRSIDTIRALAGIQGGRTDTDSMLALIDAARTRASRRAATSVFVVVDRAPLMTVSRGFLDEAITIVGGRNVASGDPAAYPRFSREAVVQLDPDVILVPDESIADVTDLLGTFPEWRTLTAVRNGRIHRVESDLLFRPGPRIVETVTLLERLLDAPGGE